LVIVEVNTVVDLTIVKVEKEMLLVLISNLSFSVIWDKSDVA
jgi:hypothetical protein